MSKQTRGATLDIDRVAASWGMASEPSVERVVVARPARPVRPARRVSHERAVRRRDEHQPQLPAVQEAQRRFDGLKVGLAGLAVGAVLIIGATEVAHLIGNEEIAPWGHHPKAPPADTRGR